LLTTADLVRLTGVKESVIRQYVLLGLIRPVARTESGRLRFDEKTVRLVKLIKELNRSGYTLREIREIFLERWWKRREQGEEK